MGASDEIYHEPFHGQTGVAEGPESIDGWLWIPAATLVVVALGATHSVLDGELTRSSAALLALNIMLGVAAVALLTLFFARSTVVPSLMIAFYVVLLCVCAIEYVGAEQSLFGVTPEVAARSVAEAKHALWHVIPAAIVWIPYFVVSKRVKNTFVR